MKCPNCRKNKATIHPIYGILPCKKCQNKSHVSPSRGIEFTTEEIKEERKEYAKDILQPHRKGQLSKEWLEVYGKEAAKKRGFTNKEINSAKNVWKGDITYYKE